MPSHLKIFFWLIAAIGAYWMISIGWFILFPPAEVTAALAKLPPAMREAIAQRAWTISLVSTAIRAAVFVGLAWLAAFRRHNWARLAVLAIFVLMQAVPLILAARHGAAGQFVHAQYLNFQADLVFALFVIAILFSFTGNARGAFKR